MNADDQFEILNEIFKWEMELKKLENLDEDESEQILEIKEVIANLNAALVEAK